jgi:hypothetical protein
MDSNGAVISVRLSSETVAKLEKLARQTGENRTQLVRRIIAIGTPLLEAGVDPNLRRLFVIAEHTQMALAHMMENEYPDVAAEIIQLAQDNVAEHHG